LGRLIIVEEREVVGDGIVVPELLIGEGVQLHEGGQSVLQLAGVRIGLKLVIL
jgi:hypothetical protein